MKPDKKELIEHHYSLKQYGASYLDLERVRLDVPA